MVQRRRKIFGRVLRALRLQMPLAGVETSRHKSATALTVQFDA
jgi:hypothetical protein